NRTHRPFITLNGYANPRGALLLGGGHLFSFMESFMLTNVKSADRKDLTLSNVIDFHLNLGKIHIDAKIEKLFGNTQRADELDDKARELVSEFAYSAELVGFSWAKDEFFKQNPAYGYFIYRGEKDA